MHFARDGLDLNFGICIHLFGGRVDIVGGGFDPQPFLKSILRELVLLGLQSREVQHELEEARGT
jgi:hypothetical protein